MAAAVTPVKPMEAMSPMHAFACIRCSERKVKCNRQDPCYACIKHNMPCVYRTSKPPRKKRDLTQSKALKEKLKYYETLLQEKGIDPDQGLDENLGKLEIGDQSPSSPSKSPETASHARTPDDLCSRVVQERSWRPKLMQDQRGATLVDNSLFVRVAEEIGENDESTDEDLHSSSDHEEASPDNDLEYALGGPALVTPPVHPSSDVIRFLFDKFITNVNPMSKIVHVPTLRPSIQAAIDNIRNVPRALEAFMFSMYSLSVQSLGEEECMTVLGMTRAKAHLHFVSASKTALSRAKFMSTSSIMVVQALVLHCLAVREFYDARAVWCLFGLVLRVAESVGLRVDGTVLGLSPFETEIRRRIWWQLKMYDFRGAELAGQAKFKDFSSEDTHPKAPANVNDSDLYPSMTSPPESSNKPTEMIWCSIRVELATFARSQLEKVAHMRKTGHGMAEDFIEAIDMTSKDQAIAELEIKIQKDFMQYCDPTDPLQFMTLLAGRSAIDLIKFISHHPRRWKNLTEIPQTEYAFVWDLAMTLLSRYNMMQSTPNLQRFAWNVPYFIQWHVVIHVLDTLRSEPQHTDAEKAWSLIDTLFELNPDMLLHSKKPIYVAVGSLCLKAYDARVALWTSQGQSVPFPRPYITRLQERRHKAKLRQQRRLKPSGNHTNKPPMNGSTFSPSSIQSMPDQQMSNPMNDPNLQQFNIPSQNFQDSTAWFDNGLNHAFQTNGMFNDMMNVDLDSVLTQDIQAVDWSQWDAWMNGTAAPVMTNPPMNFK